MSDILFVGGNGLSQAVLMESTWYQQDLLRWRRDTDLGSVLLATGYRAHSHQIVPVVRTSLRGAWRCHWLSSRMEQAATEWAGHLGLDSGHFDSQARYYKRRRGSHRPILRPP